MGEKDQEVFMYCTKDLNTITKYSFSEPEWRNGVTWIYTKVDDATYNQLCFLKNKVKSEINNSVPPLTKKQLIGRWKKDTPRKSENSSFELCLLKNGTTSYNANVNLSEEINDSVIVYLSFKIVDRNGKWILNNRELTLDLRNSVKEISLTDIKVEGIDESEIGARIIEIRKLFEQNKEEIGEKVSVDFLKLSDTNKFVVETLDENRLIIAKDSDKIVLVKEEKQ